MKDDLLKEGLCRSDKEVFEYIFNYYYSSLCAFAIKYINDPNVIEDLVQDFFVSLWKDAPGLQIKYSLRSYLFTSVKHRCLDYIKHQKIENKYRKYVLSQDENYTYSNEHYFVECELRNSIEKSLEKLSPRCRDIFILSRLNGLSNKEISKRLKISRRTVELQISNSLKILKSQLAEYLRF